MRPRVLSLQVNAARQRAVADKDGTTMSEPRDAALSADTPARLAHPTGLDARRTHAAPASPLRMAWLSVTAGVGLVIVVSLGVDLAVRIGGQSVAVETSTTVRSHLGPGYPEHHGLAGPSRVGPIDVTVGISAGYPPHYGLAGPSRVGPSDVPAGLGAGYPPHFGLAGPSQVGPSDAPIGLGAGYPPHHGLAGPSQVGSGGPIGFGAGYPPHYGLAGPSQLGAGN